MKRINSIWVIILLIISGCSGGQKSGSNSYITIDVTKNYPKKELILQDFMDVEYIALETTDEFICQDLVHDIGKEFIVVTNRVGGDIFIFDRNGKGLRIINHTGQGPEDYVHPSSIILDEDNDEIIVNDLQKKKFVAYDLFGNFKRSFPSKEGSVFQHTHNFDKENLICRDLLFDYYFDYHDEKSRFFIISKQDGNVVNDIEISYIQKKKSTLMQGRTMAIIPNLLMRPFQNSFILTELSSDTVYRYLPDKSMVPFMVSTPSIQSMGTETFLIPSMLTDHYYLMTTVKKEYDFNRKDADFPKTHLVYDKQEKAIYECAAIYNDDFTAKRAVRIERMDYITLTNSEIVYYQIFQAD
jgi:hypothetical protein